MLSWFKYLTELNTYSIICKILKVVNGLISHDNCIKSTILRNEFHALFNWVWCSRNKLSNNVILVSIFWLKSCKFVKHFLKDELNIEMKYLIISL